MATYESSLIIRLLDKVTGPASTVTRTLTGLDRRLSGRAGIIGRVNGLAAATRGLNEATLGLGARVLAPIAAAYGGSRVIGIATDTETALVRLGITAGVSADKMKEIKREVQALAPSLGVAQGEIYKVAEALVAGGLSIPQSMAALPGVLKTAKASGTAMDEVAAAALAVMQNLKVGSNEIQTAFDYMVEGGKAGSFELKDMAREFPAMAAAADNVGMSGTNAVADLAAMAQIARKTSGSTSEAANNLVNFFDKLSAPITRKKFAEFGVDVKKVFKQAEKDGRSFVDAMIDEVQRLSKGDPFVISELFEDKQARSFLNAMITYRDELARTRAKVLGGAGAVEKDFRRVAETTSEAWARAGAAIENASEKLGDSMLPGMSKAADIVERMAGDFSGLLDDLENRHTIFDRIGDAMREPGSGEPLKVGGELSAVVDDWLGEIDRFEREILGLPPPNEVIGKWLMGSEVTDDPSRGIAAAALKRAEAAKGEVDDLLAQISAAELKALEAPTKAARAEAQAEIAALKAEIATLEATIRDARALAGRMGARDMTNVEAGQDRADARAARGGTAPPDRVVDRGGAARLWQVGRDFLDVLIDRASDEATYIEDRLDRADTRATGDAGLGNLEAALDRMTRRNERPNPRAAVRFRAPAAPAGGGDFATPAPRGVGTGGDAGGFALPVPKPEALAEAGRVAGEAFKGGISTGVAGAATEAEAANGRIAGAFATLPPRLHGSGLEAALQLAAGLRAGIPAVSEAATAAASAVASKFPQSPAREGPLRGLVSMGAKIGQQLAAGMDASPVSAAASRIAAAAAAGGALPGRGAGRGDAPGGGQYGPGPVMFHFAPSFTVQGVSNPEALARQVESLMMRDVQERMDGLFADYGIVL